MSSVVTLLNAVSAVTTSQVTSIESGALQSSTNKTLFQVTSVGGSGTVTVVLEGSLDNIGFVPIATITLTATGTVTDAVYIESLWFLLRARVTSAGTGAAITATVYREGI